MGGQSPIQVFTDQLTLSQPEGTDCDPHRPHKPHITIIAHPALCSFLRHCASTRDRYKEQ